MNKSYDPLCPSVSGKWQCSVCADRCQCQHLTISSPASLVLWTSLLAEYLKRHSRCRALALFTMFSLGLVAVQPFYDNIRIHSLLTFDVLSSPVLWAGTGHSGSFSFFLIKWLITPPTFTFRLISFQIKINFTHGRYDLFERREISLVKQNDKMNIFWATVPQFPYIRRPIHSQLEHNTRYS